MDSTLAYSIGFHKANWHRDRDSHLFLCVRGTVTYYETRLNLDFRTGTICLKR